MALADLTGQTTVRRLEARRTKNPEGGHRASMAPDRGSGNAIPEGIDRF